MYSQSSGLGVLLWFTGDLTKMMESFLEFTELTDDANVRLSCCM